MEELEFIAGKWSSYRYVHYLHVHLSQVILSFVEELEILNHMSKMKSGAVSEPPKPKIQVLLSFNCEVFFRHLGPHDWSGAVNPIQQSNSTAMHQIEANLGASYVIPLCLCPCLCLIP